MATATLALTGQTEGFAWTVQISNINGADQVKDTTKYTNSIVSATIPDLGNLFTINTTSSVSNNKVNGYDGSGVQYVTFRSTIPSGQHPTSGSSLDLWSLNLYTDIVTNSNTWTQITGTYSLSIDKFSLIYDYTNLYAPIYSKGGALTISIA